MTPEEFAQLTPGSIVSHPEYGPRIVADRQGNWATLVLVEQIINEDCCDEWFVLHVAPPFVFLAPRPPEERHR